MYKTLLNFFLCSAVGGILLTVGLLEKLNRIWVQSKEFLCHFNERNKDLP